MCILQLTLEEDLKNSFSQLLSYSLYHNSNEQIKKCKHFSSKFAIILLKNDSFLRNHRFS